MFRPFYPHNNVVFPPQIVLTCTLHYVSTLKFCVNLWSSSNRPTRLNHHTRSYFLTITSLGDLYKSHIFSLCNVLNYPHTASFFCKKYFPEPLVFTQLSFMQLAHSNRTCSTKQPRLKSITFSMPLVRYSLLSTVCWSALVLIQIFDISSLHLVPVSNCIALNTVMLMPH
jgi:hypothetical protein